MIAFEIPGPPVGKGRPRAFRAGAGVRMFTPEKTASYESLVKLAARQAMRDAASIAPDSRYVQVEHAGHAPFLTHAAEVADVLFDFLAEQGA